ncbi:hypothetical protein JZO83_01675 [Enterococcus sp. DIV1298c]|uniref:DUF2974 domain-containing protein n=1 Tax=Candidatus Enterococcus mangumiae TaxID=2230878 RepID=A0ABZ2T3M8_9ENTE|nr:MULTISPECIES: hypothetical protein [unclassified Enterococcus]MBO0460445.1 hypothetical protein [Enterococcus sp. DIV1298c]MBO0490717.1 hypothetical protein [Enterococcus sp. DIV1094]
MTVKNTEKDKVEIAKKQYEQLDRDSPFSINNNKINIGYVSHINSKFTGEQSFIITDTKYVPLSAPLSERENVKEVTVLYRGSSFDSSLDTKLDWIYNNFYTAFQVINGGGSTGMPQLQSSAVTLQKTLKAYPNAEFNVYGHSLGSMNAQYALASISSSDADRVYGYVYQGPNIYEVLTPEQKQQADYLTEEYRVLNYIDSKDLVTIGYGNGKKAVGQIVYPLSEPLGLMGTIDQHMWGGYQFDEDGDLLTTNGSGNVLIEYQRRLKERSFAGLMGTWGSQAGGMSTIKEVYLDAVQAKSIVSGMKSVIDEKITDLMTVYQTGIDQANELWQATIASARSFGSNLTEMEQIEALEQGGVTRQQVLIEPVTDYEASLNQLRSIKSSYEDLIYQINRTIERQIQLDSELASQFKKGTF